MRVIRLVFLLFISCGQPPALDMCNDGALPGRANQLAEILRADNHYFYTQNPAGVQEKFSRLAADTFDWMRGTAALWYYDLQYVGQRRLSLSVPATLAQRTTLLIGDPHPACDRFDLLHG